jgi:hypothetical protein
MTSDEFCRECERIAHEVMPSVKALFECSIGDDGKYYLYGDNSAYTIKDDWSTVEIRSKLFKALKDAGAMRIQGKLYRNAVRVEFVVRKSVVPKECKNDD